MLTQELQQKLLLKLSPQQIQLMKLIQLPTVALEQRIKNEIEENPALEEIISDENLQNDENQQIENNEFEDIKNTDEDNDTEENLSSELFVDDADSLEELGFSDNDDEYINDNSDEIAYYKLNINNSSPDENNNSIPFST
jgi:RNA polymerase sigma-54 factor